MSQTTTYDVLIPQGGTLFQQGGDFTTIAASGAVPSGGPGTFVITDTGVAALTLAAPVPTSQDGDKITIFSTTAHAHTLTATGLLQTGSASVNEATFAAHPGAGLTLLAYQGYWVVQYAIGITFS